MANLGYQTMRPSKKDNVFWGILVYLLKPYDFTHLSYVNKIDGNYMRLAVDLPLHI